MKSRRIEEYKGAIIFLKEYSANKNNYVIIHFARQNYFDERLQKGPRIISIAISYPGIDVTSTYSLHRSAEMLKKNFLEASDKEKDEIEKRMLADFFNEVKNNNSKKWLHWNMKNDNFGFQTLYRRYEELGGNIEDKMKIEDDKKKNISTLFKEKYGPNYITQLNETRGKMYALLEKNRISDPDLLDGQTEVIEFASGNIVKVELSVLAKVKIFAKLMDYAQNNELITECKKWKDIYGISISGIAQYIVDNAALALAFSIISGVVVTIICHFIGI